MLTPDTADSSLATPGRVMRSLLFTQGFAYTGAVLGFFTRPLDLGD